MGHIGDLGAVMAVRCNKAILITAIGIAALVASAERTGAKPTSAANAQSAARYWVQSGAFKSEANARARCDVLKKNGYRFAVQSGVDSRGDHLFFCRSSQTLAYEKAATLAKRLRLKEPRDAVLVPRRPNGLPGRGVGSSKKEAAGDLESFSGRWCGDPAVYGTDPLQTWTVKKGGGVTLQIGARRTPDGQPEKFQGNIEKLPGNLIKLTGETASYRLEAVYGIDASGLRGVSFHQELKDNGTSMTTIPDSLHRCP
jgi:hypothetical protein